MPISRRLTLAAALALGVLAAAAAQTEFPRNPHAPPPPDPILLEHPIEGPRPPQAAPSPGTDKAPELTRLDLALAFIRFERAFVDARPAGEDLALANRNFDTATFAFFRGGRDRSLKELDDGTLRLMGREGDGAARRAATLHVRVEPPVWTYFSDPAPSIVVRTARVNGAAGTVLQPAAPDSTDTSLAIRLDPAELSGLGAGGGVQINIPDDAGADDKPTRLDLAPFIKSLKPGRYSVSIVGKDGFRWAAGWWTVVTAPRDGVRAALADRFDTFERAQSQPLAPEVKDRLEVLRARLALLRDTPSSQSVSGFLIDVNRLEDELLADAVALQEGTEPLKTREGLVFGPFRSAGVTVPMWTFVPQRLVEENNPAPLLIALHGAGAEESMFMAGYGNGVIRDIAERHGVIVASPLAYAFTTNPAILDDLIKAVRSRYAVDERRIYLVGHSMGGIAASGLAQVRAGTIAAAAAIAGLRPFRGAEPCAPVLAYGAELDRIIPAARVARLAEEARAAGLPVELREAKQQGHTLVVGAVLEECVEWLLQHRRPEP
ncbi:MAG: alpha/beta fold hydrolase [Phycisphaerales bacterium]